MLFSTGRLPLCIRHIYNRMCSRISFRVRVFSRWCHARLSRSYLRRVRLSCRCRGKIRNSTALRMDERRGAGTTFFRSLDTRSSLCSHSHCRRSISVSSTQVEPGSSERSAGSLKLCNIAILQWFRPYRETDWVRTYCTSMRAGYMLCHPRDQRRANRLLAPVLI